MSTIETFPAWPVDRHEFLAFAPMICVAWSDGVLSDREFTALESLLCDQPWVDDGGRALLHSWLDAENPPTASALQELREHIRRLWPDDRELVPLTLAGLGMELIRASGLTVGPWSEDGAPEALAAAEEALGVHSPEAVRSLLDISPEARGPEPRALRDPSALNHFLDADHRELRERTLALLASDDFGIPFEADRAEQRRRTLAAVRRLAEEGLGALAYPEEFGGADDPGGAIAVFETLAYGPLSIPVKFGVQFGLFGGSVLQLGTRRHHERWLGAIGRLELPGCYAMTELGHGSNVRELETRATWIGEADEFEIHTPSESAVKDWIGNAAVDGRMATVFAQLEVDGEEHGVHAFLVPIRDGDGRPLEGVEIRDRGAKEGLNGVDNGQLRFDRVRIPRENLLNRFGDVDSEGVYHSPIPSPGRRFFTMLGTLVAGRVSVAAASNSVARSALTIAVRRAASRRQFGPEGAAEVPILSYLHVQRELLPRLAKSYALHFAVRRLVERFAESGGADAHELEGMAAGVKASASWHAVDTLQACREICGGEGYDAENRFGRMKADADIFTTFEGANAVLLQLVAKGLLSEFRDEMGDLQLWGIMRFVAGRAQTRITEMNPVAKRRTDAEHLRDPELHAAAFRYREERLLISAARRLEALVDGGMEAFDAMNATQDHLILLAEAHVDRLVLECMQDAVARAPDPGLSETLRSVATLHALATLEAHRAWYLEADYMEPSKTKAIRTEVNRLCSELADEAVFLVDAFGIPDAVLGAPIAVDR